MMGQYIDFDWFVFVLITFGEHWISSFPSDIGGADLNDFVDLLGVRQTLRIQWFGQQIAS